MHFSVLYKSDSPSFFFFEINQASFITELSDPYLKAKPSYRPLTLRSQVMFLSLQRASRRNGVTAASTAEAPRLKWLHAARPT